MRVAGNHDEQAPPEILRRFYTTLLESFGPQGWWPARTRWEVICGAILTQNTTWQNATLALKNLRRAGLLHGRTLRQSSLPELEQLIRPAGFYRQKARTLHNLANWIEHAHAGTLDSLFSLDAATARAQLLAHNGIGPETADAILLYSGRHPVFVADAYTRRVLSRHELLSSTADYHSAQQFLHQHLPPDEGLFNEFHALLVETGKRFCHRHETHCEQCPLGKFLGPDSKSPTRKSKFEVRSSTRNASFDSRPSALARG
jgi:endonuclease-3 related protein